MAGGLDVEAVVGGHLERGELDLAVSAAVRGYGPQLLGYLVTVLRDEATAREVFAAACEDLWRGIGTFRRESTFRAWAYRVAWNAARQHLRDPFRRRARRLETADLDRLVASVRSATRPEQRTSARDHLGALRARLSPSEQTLLTLRLGRDLSWAEIAAVLSAPGLPESEAAVKKRFERLKKKLRALAEADGLLEER